MYKVNILTSENALFSTVFGPYDMFLQAGVFWNALNKKKQRHILTLIFHQLMAKKFVGWRELK